MALTKEQKGKIIKDLEGLVSEEGTLVFVDFKGLESQDLERLRLQLKEKESGFRVAKKTLLKIALKNKKIDLNLDNIQGQVALAYNLSDKITPAKTVYDFAKGVSGLAILGGLFDKNFQSKETVIELAELPGREDMLAIAVGTLAAPLTGFLAALEGNITNLLFTLEAIKDKKQ